MLSVMSNSDVIENRTVPPDFGVALPTDVNKGSGGDMLGVQHGVGENPFIRFISGIKNRENTSIFIARYSISFMHLNVHKYQDK